MLSIRRTKPNEAVQLHRIQKEAFQEDLNTYQDFETNPACESIDRLLYKINTYDYYTLFFHSEVIGGAAVRKSADREYRISPMYLSPDYQNKGLGSQILRSLLALYPDARLWTLDTPKQSIRNGHFYEKLGFIPIGEKYINEQLTLTRYQREMK
ncbi:MAG: hypothetical protein K0S39_5351 [Paenibacillus sp.]|nr:hypothetical protein [Paenibacillus sp.]